jgi:hypothetical protein
LHSSTNFPLQQRFIERHGLLICHGLLHNRAEKGANFSVSVVKEGGLISKAQDSHLVVIIFVATKKEKITASLPVSL